MQPDENKNTKLKIYVDIVSAISITFFIAQTILAFRYYPNESSRNPDGSFPLFTILLLVNAVPLLFSVPWLMIRYSHVLTRIAKKYPFLQTRLFLYFFMFGLPLIITYLLKR